MCSRTNIAFSVAFYLFLFLVLSQKYTNAIINERRYRECIWRNRMFSLRFNQETNTQGKRKRKELVDRALLKALPYMHVYLIALNKCSNWSFSYWVESYTSILKIVCSLSFFFHCFFVLFDTLTLITYTFSAFSSLMQSAVQIHIYVEITLNGPWTVMMMKGTLYIIYIGRERE